MNKAASRKIRLRFLAAFPAVFLAVSLLVASRGGWQSVSGAVPGTVFRVGAAGCSLRTAAETARLLYPASETVVVVRSDLVSEGAAAAALAGKLGAPLITSGPQGLPPQAAEAIAALGAKRALLVGGAAAVTPEVAGVLRSMGLEVERVGGADRYETAMLVAGRLRPAASPAGYAFIVNANAAADALISAPAAFKNRAPVLLVNRDSLPAATRQALAELSIGGVYIIGGREAVSEKVARELAGLTRVYDRYAGATRCETAAAFAVSPFVNRAGLLLVNSAGNLLGQALGAAPYGWPVLFVGQERLPPAAGRYLAGFSAQKTGAAIIGSLEAVSRQLEDKVRAMLAGAARFAGPAARRPFRGPPEAPEQPPPPQDPPFSPPEPPPQEPPPQEPPPQEPPPLRLWQYVGARGFSAGGADFLSLAINDGGRLFLAYRDEANSGKATVMQYTGSGWLPLGRAGFSAGVIYSASLGLSAQGTPYLAFRDGARLNHATVMRFSGSDWTTVGGAGFSPGSAGFLRLAVDGQTGQPMVAFVDGAKSGRITAMRFDGAAWAVVGNAGFSSVNASRLSLALDGQGVPYVAFRDEANGLRATAMKFEGGAWQPVGRQGFSAGKVNFISLVTDGGAPYVAFQDEAHGLRATVMKFDGAAWQVVGSPGFTAGRASALSMDICGGFIYVAFRELDKENRLTVMRFNGLSWEALGGRGVSAGAAADISLRVEQGIPYVAFRDGAAGDAASVLKYSF